MDLSDQLYVTSLTIEGFGRFQEATTIELAPVTFLIGPNGAGKSTVAKVLLLLQEVFAESPVPVENRYRSAPGTCRVWWMYHEALAPKGVGFGVSIAYGGVPRIDSYLLLHDGETALEWTEELSDDPAFWLQTRYDLEGEDEVIELSYHASCLDAKTDESDVILHDRSFNYRRSNADLMAICHGLLHNNSSALVTSMDLLDAVTARTMTQLSEELSEKVNHTLRLANRLDVQNSNWTNAIKELLTQVYLPSELQLTLDKLGGSLSFDSLRNVGLINELNCVRSTRNFTKSAGKSASLIEQDQLAEYAISKALFASSVRPGILLIKAFVRQFSNVMPVRLANSLRDVVLFQDERPIEVALRIFANQWDSFELTRYIGNDKVLVQNKQDFFKSINQFGAIDLETTPAGTQAYQFKIALQSGSKTDIKDLGTGFRAIICIYAWLIAGLRYPEIAMSRYGDYALFEDEAKDVDVELEIRVRNFELLYLEEIESALHPSAQSNLFQLILAASPTQPGIVFADEVSFGWSLVDQTDEEQAEAKKLHDEAVAAAPKARAKDQRIPRRPLIFETHSEYIIRTALNMVARGDYPPGYFAINYIHAPALQPQGEPAAYRIPIRSNGTLAREFGPGFFDEAQRLKLELLDLNRVQVNQEN